MKDCCTSSFCFYITVTCFLNLPPIIVGLMDAPNVVKGCQSSYWLLVFWILCVINIVAAFYMAVAVEKDDTILPSDAEQGMSNFDAYGGASRMKQLFCYDGWMAAYILIVCGFFVWLVLGIGVIIRGNEDGNCKGIMDTVVLASAFGWAFVSLGGFALCCSVCCGVFNNFQRRQRAHRQPPTTAVQMTSAASAMANQTTTPVTPSAPPDVEPVPVFIAEPVPAAKPNVY
eukprot:CAMPEP_0172482612 /NCGR_PEP_ID=MMETSP1066-20121228/9120_1 /TAXON_ID=671091 /ORGANISM="Coscinodiscus wailesii, Strain CCMP2513" /LENGTH=228 /DNA_ID=CAMNT_0013245871 /DNA_START=282 /DNA_END=968 /DNA_ORIENTATION=+